jgi:hypothetical protein
MGLEPVAHPTQEPRRRGSQDAEPELLHVQGTRVDAEGIGHRIKPRDDPQFPTGVDGRSGWTANDSAVGWHGGGRSDIGGGWGHGCLRVQVWGAPPGPPRGGAGALMHRADPHMVPAQPCRPPRRRPCQGVCRPCQGVCRPCQGGGRMPIRPTGLRPASGARRAGPHRRRSS